MLPNIPRFTGQSPYKELPGSNVNSAQIEKAFYAERQVLGLEHSRLLVSGFPREEPQDLTSLV